MCTYGADCAPLEDSRNAVESASRVRALPFRGVDEWGNMSRETPLKRGAGQWFVAGNGRADATPSACCGTLGLFSVCTFPEVSISTKAIFLDKTNRSKSMANSRQGGTIFFFIPNIGSFLSKPFGNLPVI